MARLRSEIFSALILGSILAPRLAPAAMTAAADAGEWPGWRGPKRDGASTETGLLAEWPKDGPRLVWTAVGAGGGYSTVSLAGGKLFTQGDRLDGAYVIAFDPATGKEIWSFRGGPVYPNSRGGGPRSTPTVDGDRVYALDGGGNLSCLDAATGKKRFALNILDEFKGSNPHWGISESPLIEKDLVIITPGGSVATVAALDKMTGKMRWTLLQRDKAAYSSTIAADLAGRRQVLAVTNKGLIGMDAADGKFLWRYDKAANQVATVPTPIARGDHVFVSSGYGAGAALLKIVKDGEGFQAQEIYFEKRMQNHHATSVLVGDHIFGYSDRSSFACMEFLTGKIVYPSDEDSRKKNMQKCGLVYADGHFYCLGEVGEMVLAEANTKEFVAKSRFKPFEMQPDPKAKNGRRNTWAHPVVAGGRLFLRNQDNIYCYDIKAPAP